MTTELESSVEARLKLDNVASDNNDSPALRRRHKTGSEIDVKRASKCNIQ